MLELRAWTAIRRPVASLAGRRVSATVDLRKHPRTGPSQLKRVCAGSAHSVCGKHSVNITTGASTRTVKSGPVMHARTARMDGDPPPCCKVCLFDRCAESQRSTALNKMYFILARAAFSGPAGARRVPEKVCSADARCRCRGPSSFARLCL